MAEEEGNDLSNPSALLPDLTAIAVLIQQIVQSEVQQAVKLHVEPLIHHLEMKFNHIDDNVDGISILAAELQEQAGQHKHEWEMEQYDRQLEPGQRHLEEGVWANYAEAGSIAGRPADAKCKKSGEGDEQGSSESLPQPSGAGDTLEVEQPGESLHDVPSDGGDCAHASEAQAAGYQDDCEGAPDPLAAGRGFCEQSDGRIDVRAAFGDDQSSGEPEGIDVQDKSLSADQFSNSELVQAVSLTQVDAVGIAKEKFALQVQGNKCSRNAKRRSVKAKTN